MIIWFSFEKKGKNKIKKRFLKKEPKIKIKRNAFLKKDKNKNKRNAFLKKRKNQKMKESLFFNFLFIFALTFHKCQIVMKAILSFFDFWTIFCCFFFFFFFF